MGTGRSVDTPGRLYRRWWMAGPWATAAAVAQLSTLAGRADDGYDPSEPILRSLWDNQPTAWPHGGDQRARCRLRRHQGGAVPAPRCSCGLHGCDRLVDALNHDNLGTDRWQAAGEISVWGRVLPGPHPGVWRAERAELVALFDISSMWRSAGWVATMSQLPRGVGDLPQPWKGRLTSHLGNPTERWEARARDYQEVLAVVADRYKVPVITITVNYDDRLFSVGDA